MSDEVSWNDVDVHAIGNAADRVLVADHIVGVGSIVSNGSSEYSVDSSLDAQSPHIGLGRFHKRIDSADREVSPHYTTLRVQSTWECRERKPERRLICRP